MGKKDKDEDFGSSMKFDPEFNGPLKNRSCTDVLCLLLFVAFLVCWGVVAYFAFAYGDPQRLLNPTDSEGRRCGIDPIVKDKRYLVFFDMSKCANPSVVVTGCDTPQVCVEKCPDNEFLIDAYQTSSLAELKKKLICKYDIDVEAITSYSVALELTRSEKCAPWYLRSQSVQGRCVPTKAKDAGKFVLATFFEMASLVDRIFHPGRAATMTTIPPMISNATSRQIERNYQAFFAHNYIGQMMVDDLAQTWPWIIAMLALAMVSCLIFIILMRWFAGVMVWISLIGVHVMLSYCVYACWTKYVYTRDHPPDPTSGLNLEQQAKALLAMKGTWMAFFVISCILLCVVFLLTIFLRNRIRVAIALIGEASKAVGSITSTLAFPLVPWVLQCLVIAWTVVLIFYLAGSGKEVFQVTGLGEGKSCDCISNGVTSQVKDGSVCTITVFDKDCQPNCVDANCRFFSFVTEKYVDYLHAINIIGFFWALFFISAIGEMILASTFATWYWTFDKSDVPFFTLTEAIGRTFRYNLGTVAFGSLILAICRMIRVILEFVSNQLKKYDNFCVKCMLCCCKCFFWCLENFIKFINRNAYIMCAVHGKNFCTSAKDAFNLLMRNVVRVFVLDKVTDFLLLLGKLLVTSGVCALSFFIFDGTIKVPVDGAAVPTLNYSLMPVFIVGFGSYFIATIFFGVYSMAVDTLFLCFLEDSERNDGSVEKPYYMSKSLRKILDKKNK